MKWGIEDELRLLRLRKMGNTFDKIGEVLGVTTSACISKFSYMTNENYIVGSVAVKQKNEDDNDDKYEIIDRVKFFNKKDLKKAYQSMIQKHPIDNDTVIICIMFNYQQHREVQKAF